MAAINNDWAEALKEEYRKPYYRELYKKINEEYRTREIFPPSDEIFSAFHLTPLKDVKVVILGQDPYHNNGQAHGLSFSVKPGVDIPPSLVNIYKELHDDLGCYIPKFITTTYYSIIILGKFSWRRSRCKLTCTQWEIFLPKFLKSSFLLP